MLRVKYRNSSSSAARAYPESTTAINDSVVECASVVSTISTSTPAAGVYTVDTGSNQITLTGHGYQTGLKVQVSVSGTLASPLVTATDYFVILYDGNTIGLATTQANAIAGAAIDLTTAGSGTQTMTPVTFAGGSLNIEVSNDGTTWGVLASTAITANGVYTTKASDICARYVRFTHNFTSGLMAYNYSGVIKGEFNY